MESLFADAAQTVRGSLVPLRDHEAVEALDTMIVEQRAQLDLERAIRQFVSDRSNIIHYYVMDALRALDEVRRGNGAARSDRSVIGRATKNETDVRRPGGGINR